LFDALVANEIVFFEYFENLMAEQELCCMRINIWNREPLTGGSPYAPGNEGMYMGVPKQGIGKGLNDSHHCGSYFVIIDRGSHELFYCVISGTTELSEQLPLLEGKIK